MIIIMFILLFWGFLAEKFNVSSSTSVFCMYWTSGHFVFLLWLQVPFLTMHVLFVAASFHVFYWFVSLFAYGFFPPSFPGLLLKIKNKLADVDAGNNLLLLTFTFILSLTKSSSVFQVQVYQQGALQSSFPSVNQNNCVFTACDATWIWN